MKFLSRRFCLFLLPVAAALAATPLSTDKPIINFRSATFTAEGFRSWLVRGSEATVLPGKNNQIAIKELTLSIFPAKAQDEKVETMILSPTALVLPDESVVTGPTSIRVLNDQFEATGNDWRYLHKEKRVLISQDVHVVFRSELKDFLK